MNGRMKKWYEPMVESLKMEVIALAELVVHLLLGAVLAVVLAGVAVGAGALVGLFAGLSDPNTASILTGVKLAILVVDVIMVLCVVVRAASKYISSTVKAVKRAAREIRAS